MKIRIKNLRKIINEVIWDAYRIRDGEQIDTGIAVDANTRDDAKKEASKKFLRLTGEEVASDEIDVRKSGAGWNQEPKL